MIKNGDIAIGFRFGPNSAGVVYVPEMDNYIGKSGIVNIIGDYGSFQIHFNDPYKIWTYPINEYRAIQREDKLKELGI